MIAYGLANNGICNGVNMAYRINRTTLHDIATKIEGCVKLALQEQYYADKNISVLVDGLSHIAAYLFIPYGEEGLCYVKSKIYPQTIEDFLRERAECLLEKTYIFNRPEYQELIRAAYEYCEKTSENSLPFHPISLVMLSVRLESELIKHFTIVDYSTPKSVSASHDAFVEHKLRYFYNLRDGKFSSIAFDDHLSQLMEKFCVEEPFTFSDIHRREIDGLPIFTFLLD